jgi:hypothetical protein
MRVYHRQDKDKLRFPKNAERVMAIARAQAAEQPTHPPLKLSKDRRRRRLKFFAGATMPVAAISGVTPAPPHVPPVVQSTVSMLTTQDAAMKVVDDMPEIVSNVMEPAAEKTSDTLTAAEENASC